MIEFFTRLFRRETSGSTAKERLRLVLLSDHLSLAPEMVEALKRDLIEVISRYVEVDAQACDVSFEQQDRTVAMLANIPILGVPHSNGRGGGPPRNGHAAAPKLEVVPSSAGPATSTAVLEPPPEAVAELPAGEEHTPAPQSSAVEPSAEAPNSGQPEQSSGPSSHAMAAAPSRATRRRRRRRPPGMQTLPTPGT